VLTVARLVLLDSGPLGMASDNPVKLHTGRVLAWIAALDAAGTDVVVPEIADYEIRRELIRASKTAEIVRLDDLEQDLIYLPLTTNIRHLGRFPGIDARPWQSIR
jgi:hypothetical protein